MFLDETVDGGLKVNDGVEDAVFQRRRVSLAKKPSTALRHEQEVGTKWKVQRGCRVSHSRTFGCLCVAFGGKMLHWIIFLPASLSRMTCTALSSGSSASMALDARMNY